MFTYSFSNSKTGTSKIFIFPSDYDLLFTKSFYYLKVSKYFIDFYNRFYAAYFAF